MASPEADAHRYDVQKAGAGQIYAKAFFGMAEKLGQTGPLIEEFDALLEQVFDKFPQLLHTLASPRVAVDEKLGILDRVFQGRISDPLLRFLKVVCRHGRMDALRHIRNAARDLYDQKLKRVRVSVTTAAPLDAPLIDRIRQVLSEKLGREVRLEHHVRPELIGGLVVRVGDTVFDGSIANQFQQMRRQAIEQAVQQLRRQEHIVAVEA